MANIRNYAARISGVFQDYIALGDLSALEDHSLPCDQADLMILDADMIVVLAADRSVRTWKRPRQTRGGWVVGART